MSSGGSNAVQPTTEVDRLIRQPYEFDFVQAVSLLQHHAARDGSVRSFVGLDNSIRDEVVRFRVAPTLRNNACQVVDVQVSQEPDTNYEMTVSFLGLIGVNGVLPRHYTQTLISRVKEHDYAMRDFLDLFHHRTISMFFRASIKYHLPFVYQTQQGSSNAGDDSITQAIRCLVGLGEPTLKHKLAFPDFSALLYGGHFSDTKPTAHSLARVVEDFIGLPTKVLEFQFEWLYIDPVQQTRLTTSNCSQLGRSAVAGGRVPSFQNRFRIRVGPVKWRDFVELLPTSTQVDKLADLVRLYVGISLDFDLQVTVRGQGIPACTFQDSQPPRLGWTTWLFSEPTDSIVEDAVFDIGAI